jgi:drug/metabolite transporter (DMT)-like permease
MGWRGWTALAVLCLWQASGWLLPADSEVPSQLERSWIACALVALISSLLVLGGKRTPATQGHPRRWGAVAAAGALMFSVPAILLQGAREYAPETNATVIFSLAPVVVVLLCAAASSSQRSMAMLLPALAGSAGVLLILPFEWPTSSRGWESLLEISAAMVLASCAAVWLYALLQARREMVTLAVIGLANAAVLLFWCGLRGELAMRGWGTQSVVAVFSEAAIFALTVWLVGAIDPARFSARFLVVPLLTVVEGMMVLRPEFNGRLVAGLALLLAGSGLLLRGNEAVEDEVLSLR